MKSTSEKMTLTCFPHGFEHCKNPEATRTRPEKYARRMSLWMHFIMWYSVDVKTSLKYSAASREERR